MMQYGEATGLGYLFYNLDGAPNKEFLVMLLVQGDSLGRKGAIDGLSKLNEKAMVPTFLKMMRTDPSIRVRQAAYHALIQFTGQNFGPVDKSASWDEWWEKNKNTWPTK
jgi:hypothetical protein